MRNLALGAAACGLLLDIGTAQAAGPINGAVAPGMTVAPYAWNSSAWQALSVDGSGNLNVNVQAGGGSGSGNAAAGTLGVAPPLLGDYLAFTNGSGNLVGVTSTVPLPTVDANSGANNTPITPGTATATKGNLTGCQSQNPASLTAFTAGQQGAVPCDLAGRLIVHDYADSNSGTMPVSAASLPLPTGAATSANQVVPTAAGTSGANAASIQGIAGGVAVPVSLASNSPVYLQAVATGGATPCRGINSAASTMAANCKASTGLVYNISFTTTITGGAAFRLYANTGVPTVGSGTPVWSCVAFPTSPCTFNSDVGMLVAGIAYTVTGGFTDTDTTTLTTAGTAHVALNYK